MATVQKWFTGTSAPATTPSNIGDFFVDTTNSKAYIATGTSSSADWQPISLNLALPVDDSTSLVNDPSDDTKQVRIDAGNITTGTVRVLTMTDADLDLANVLQNISEDSTPQLGASLDVNGNKIVSVSNGDIDIEPNGTGNVLLGNMTFDADQTIGAGQDNYVLTYDDGAGVISLEAAAAAGLSNVVEDTTPQLGGMLDVNGNSIGDGTLELLKFTETGSAVNEFTIANAATAGAPVLSATGDDANIGITLTPKGTGNITLGTMAFDSDQSIGAGQDNYVLTYDNGTGLISLEAVAAAGGGILPTTDTDKTTNYTIVSGDIGDRIYLTSAASADSKFTLDVSLFADSGEAISFCNESAYKLTIEVSNTGTMTFNNNVTDLVIWKGDPCLTVGGDTATNANVIAGG